MNYREGPNTAEYENYTGLWTREFHFNSLCAMHDLQPQSKLAKIDF